MFSFYGDTVLDPFCGTATTMLAAMRTDRHSIGIEIDPEYCKIALNRLGQESNNLFNNVALESLCIEENQRLRLVRDYKSSSWKTVSSTIIESFSIPSKSKKLVIKKFRTIPGIGKKIAEDLWDLGLRSMDELKGRDPEELYTRLCAIKEEQVDPCVLYVFRCAIYYVSNTTHDPQLLKWWNWKDK